MVPIFVEIDRRKPSAEELLRVVGQRVQRRVEQAIDFIAQHRQMPERRPRRHFRSLPTCQRHNHPFVSFSLWKCKRSASAKCLWLCGEIPETKKGAGKKD